LRVELMAAPSKQSGAVDPAKISSEQRLTLQQVRRFRQTICDYYQQNERKFPWRETDDPYRILVSEIMLQQTQVQRVVSKYVDFIKLFPDLESLAVAPFREVMTAWQGLGYNRRAMLLQRIAQRVVNEFGGILPDSVAILETFPGIGKATAGALVAFAFHQPAVFIETNIRRVFIHSFFPKSHRVTDVQLLPLVEQTLDRERVRPWYYALMDYGVMLKSLHSDPNHRSAHYAKQSRFADSDRQIRGLVIKILSEKSSLSESLLIDAVGKDPHRTKLIIEQLGREGFLGKQNGMISIHSTPLDAIDDHDFNSSK
jgi:A/G-specific adenine glycosylase